MTRTCDLLVRSQTLYPTELRARNINSIAWARQPRSDRQGPAKIKRLSYRSSAKCFEPCNPLHNPLVAEREERKDGPKRGLGRKQRIESRGEADSGGRPGFVEGNGDGDAAAGAGSGDERSVGGREGRAYAKPVGVPLGLLRPDAGDAEREDRTEVPRTGRGGSGRKYSSGISAARRRW
jgi:hypothetical protein